MKTSQVYIILLLIDIALFLMLFNTLLAGKNDYGYLNKGYAMLYERSFDTRYTDELQEIVSNSLNHTNLLKLKSIKEINIRLGINYNDYVFKMSLYFNVPTSIGKRLEQELLETDFQYKTYNNVNYLIVNNNFIQINDNYKKIIINKSITGKYHPKKFYYDIYTDDLDKYIYQLNEEYRISLRNQSNLSFFIIILVITIINVIYIKIYKRTEKKYN